MLFQPSRIAILLLCIFRISGVKAELPSPKPEITEGRVLVEARNKANESMVVRYITRSEPKTNTTLHFCRCEFYSLGFLQRCETFRLTSVPTKVEAKWISDITCEVSVPPDPIQITFERDTGHHWFTSYVID